MLVTAVAVLAKCAYDRHVRQIDSEAMRLGLEDVSRRIRVSTANLAHITELYNETALSAARSFARIIAIDPSLIRDHSMLVELKRVLGVDELHVSDAHGVLIASDPESSVGYDMSSRLQSAAFMPAITNKAFELVQKPMLKGVENRLFQYAGVARIDQPGIVQIGLEPSRLENATSIADVNNIAASVRVGRGGRVMIVKRERSAESDAQVDFEVFESGEGRIASMQTDSDGYRIGITMPYRGWWLADDDPYRILTVCVVVLITLVLLGGLNMFGKRGFMRMLNDFKVLFEPVANGARGYRVGPVVIVAFAVFALGVIIAFAVSSKVQMQRARELMLAGEADFVEDFNAAPDGCLFFVGHAVTRYYGTPAAASQMDVRDLMSRYGIDELNIVDRNGVVLRGDLANVGFDFHSNTNTAQFLGLLGTDVTFSQRFRGAIENPGLRRKYAGVAFPAHDGFVQIGFDEKRIESDFDYRLSVLAKDRSVGDRGFCVLAGRDGQIVSSGRPEFAESQRRGEVTTLAGIDFDVTLVPEEDAGERFFKAVLYRERCLCLSRPLGKYHRLIVAMPLSAIADERNVSVLFVGALLLCVLGFGAVFGTRLSNLVAKLKAFIAEDNRRRAEELRNARMIQTEALPTVFPDEASFRLYARMDTAKEVGGDFYDFYTLPSGKFLFLIADTSGKGIPAAMFMMKAKTVIRACIFEVSDFAKAVQEANNRLSEGNDANMFVTAWIGIFDPTTLEVEFVNCGHNPPLVKHADGSVSWVRTRSCLALAAMPGVRFRSERITLGRGESLFLYTDGVTEAMNVSGEQYGEKRLESDLVAAPSFLFVEKLREQVAAFVNGAEQSDDITMLSLDCKNKEQR